MVELENGGIFRITGTGPRGTMWAREYKKGRNSSTLTNLKGDLRVERVIEKYLAPPSRHLEVDPLRDRRPISNHLPLFTVEEVPNVD